MKKLSFVLKGILFVIVGMLMTACGSGAQKDETVSNLDNITAPTVAQGEQITISGAKMPLKLGFSETVRELNGAGVREKYFVKVYVAGLYLKDKSNDPKEIINADKPMSIRLHIISSMLTNEVMIKYIREGFSKSLNGKSDALKLQIDLICQVFSSEPTKVGDVYDIHYTPGIGISCNKNSVPYSFSNITPLVNSGVVSFTPVLQDIRKTKNGQEALYGLDFKKGIFGIWLSEDPVDQKLKEGMLGLK